MNWIDIGWRVLSFLWWCLVAYAVTSALIAHSVGFFVGVNGIDWTPEQTLDAGKDRWFAFWARIGMRRGAKHR